MIDEPIPDTSKAAAVYTLACQILPALRSAARDHGYALACHGSFARDIDLIAVPWREGESGPLAVAEAIRAAAAAASGKEVTTLNDDKAPPTDYTRRSPEPKPHGRLGWSFHILGAHTYIDLSVLAAGDAWVEVKVDELRRRLDAAHDQILKQSKRAQAAEDRLAQIALLANQERT